MEPNDEDNEFFEAPEEQLETIVEENKTPKDKTDPVEPSLKRSLESWSPWEEPVKKKSTGFKVE